MPSDAPQGLLAEFAGADALGVDAADLPAEAAADKYGISCRMKNLSQRAERHKRVKLAPVRLSPKEAG